MPTRESTAGKFPPREIALSRTGAIPVPAEQLISTLNPRSRLRIDLILAPGLRDREKSNQLFGQAELYAALVI